MARPDADSRVGDGETHRYRAVLQALERRPQRHFPPLGELDGISAEIGQYLAQAMGAVRKSVE